MARKSKYNDEIVAKIITLLSQGATDKATCETVGIHADTFYTWIKDKPDFSEQVTRARGQAMSEAAETLRIAMRPYDLTEKSVETFTETRVNKHGETYEYIRKTEREVTKSMLGDWKAALEYLRRRDPDNWSERHEINGKDRKEDWRTDAIAAIANGSMTYQEVLELFQDQSLAADLFREAGVSI